MANKLTAFSWIIVAGLSVFLALRIWSAINGATALHNLIAIAGLAAMVAGTLLGGGRSYRSDSAPRTKADLMLLFGFLALISSYAAKYLWR